MKCLENYKLNKQQWTFPLLLLLICFLSYGLLIHQMFFYWDDLPTLWFYQSGGKDIFYKVFAEDRPFLANLFVITMPIIKSSLLGWQIFAIIARWLAGLVFWWLLNLIWENRKLENALFSVLFIIYPGFLQQWIAVTYSHAFIIYAVFLLSLVFMVLSLKQEEKKKYLLYLLLAILAQLFTVFCTEYFLGLEILRPFIMVIFLYNIRKEKPLDKRFLKDFLMQWGIYLVGLMVYAYWRFFILPFPRNTIQTFNGNEEIVLFFINNLGVLIRNALESGLLVWGQPFNLINYIDLSMEVWTISILFFMVAFIAYYGITTIFRDALILRDTVDKDFWKIKTIFQQWRVQVFVVALIAIVGGLIPFRLVNLVMRPIFPYDRFTLPVMFGSSLLLGLLLITFIRQPRKLLLANAIITAIVCIFHYSNALKYVKEGEIVKDFLWQLANRAPSIAENTALMTAQWPFQYNTDNSISAPLNWLYGKYPHEKMPLIILDVEARLGKSISGTKDENTGRIEITKNSVIRGSYRAFEFNGNTEQTIVFYYNPPACLRLMDNTLDPYLFYPESMYDVIPFSNLSLVNKKDERDPAFIKMLGKRPKKDWCIYYQEAALANQRGDWEEIKKIGQIAFNEHHLQPKDPIELFPFIEGYAHFGDWQRARDLSLQAYELSRSTRSGLCALWKQIKQGDEAPKNKIYTEIREQLRCDNG